jgi:hypothetical protein
MQRSIRSGRTIREENAMKRICDFYIRHAGLVGALYCAVPTLLWFLVVVIVVQFREVYLLRLALSLLLGCPLAALVNRRGVSFYLLKHRSPEGPATISDGILIGFWVGAGAALVPPLTLLIRTNHLEQAKTSIIVSYLTVMGIGALIGAVLAAIGRKYLETAPAAKGE